MMTVVTEFATAEDSKDGSLPNAHTENRSPDCGNSRKGAVIPTKKRKPESEAEDKDNRAASLEEKLTSTAANPSLLERYEVKLVKRYESYLSLVPGGGREWIQFTKKYRCKKIGCKAEFLATSRKAIDAHVKKCFHLSP